MDFKNLLKRIMDSDSNIRHSLVTDNDGNVLVISHRDRVTNYLSAEETESSLKRAATAWKGRKALSSKIGNGVYAVAAFEKITRMTFPLGNENLIFVSLGSEAVRTDPNAGGQKQIIEHGLNILSKDPTKS